MLRLIPVLALALLAPLANGYAAAASHLLSCLSVIESHVGEAEREFVWEPVVQPAPNRRLALTLEADAAARAVVIPWDASRSGLVNGWLPLWTTLNPGEAVRFPPTLWLWTTNSSPFRIEAVALDQNDPAVTELHDLIVAMHQPGLAPRVLAAQTRKLRALVDRLRMLQRPVTDAASLPASIAGVFRGQFDWRNHAISSSFGPGQPALVDFAARTGPPQ